VQAAASEKFMRFRFHSRRRAVHAAPPCTAAPLCTAAQTRTAAIAIAALALSTLLATSISGCGDRRDSGADSRESSLEHPAPDEVIRVTGIPDENPTELVRRSQPLVDYLIEQLDTDVRYVPVTDYGAAVEALRSGKVDFAWLGGFTFVQARRLADAEPLVMRAIDRKFQSVFIAHAESGISQPSQLKGHSFAFGSKSSTSGHLMPRHFLTSVHGIDPDADFAGHPLYTGAHDATAKTVASGKVDAGALNKLVWERLVAKGQIDTSAVKVVWETPPYVDYVWAARRGVPEIRRLQFARAFLSLDASRERDRAVLALQDAERFVPATPGDFDAIEAVGLATGLLRE
jgi:phosphonate transport system substrate-binding protein